MKNGDGRHVHLPQKKERILNFGRAQHLDVTFKNAKIKKESIAPKQKEKGRPIIPASQFSVLVILVDSIKERNKRSSGWTK